MTIYSGFGSGDWRLRMFRRCMVVSAILVLTVLFLAMNIPSAPKEREILVSAAISLKEAFIEIASLYEQQTGDRVRFNFGASGLLQKQVESGAPVDVFASAGEKQMDELQARDLIIRESRRDFTGNTLVLIKPASSRVILQSWADLSRTEVGRVAIGSPKTVPAGQYAAEALRNLRLWESIQPRLVFAENVRQVLDYVVRGEVDAGMVYESDMAGASGGVVIAARAPQGSYSPIRYPIAVVRQSEKVNDSRRFIDIVLSRAGQNILKKYGFPGSR